MNDKGLLKTKTAWYNLACLVAFFALRKYDIEMGDVHIAMEAVFPVVWALGGVVIRAITRTGVKGIF